MHQKRKSSTLGWHKSTSTYLSLQLQKCALKPPSIAVICTSLTAKFASEITIFQNRGPWSNKVWRIEMNVIKTCTKLLIPRCETRTRACFLSVSTQISMLFAILKCLEPFQQKSRAKKVKFFLRLLSVHAQILRLTCDPTCQFFEVPTLLCLKLPLEWVITNNISHNHTWALQSCANMYWATKSRKSHVDGFLLLPLKRAC